MQSEQTRLFLRDGIHNLVFLGEAAVSCTKLGEIKGMSESSIKNLLTPGTLRLELFEG